MVACQVPDSAQRYQEKDAVYHTLLQNFSWIQLNSSVTTKLMYAVTQSSTLILSLRIAATHSSVLNWS